MAANYLDLADSFKRELSLLESNLVEASAGKRIKTILVTSAKQGEGKTLAAISMAKKLAEQDNLRVLLLDGSLYNPMLHTAFSMEPSPGFAELADKQVTLEQAIRATSINNLSLLSVGEFGEHTNHKIRDFHYQDFLKQVSQDYDYVIADSGAVLGSSEVILLCSIFDATLMVVECENEKYQLVKSASDKIIAAGGNFLGTIMNRRKFYIPKLFYGL